MGLSNGNQTYFGRLHDEVFVTDTTISNQAHDKCIQFQPTHL